MLFSGGGLSVLYEDKLGVVDFHPSTETAVIYISEADLVTGQMYKRKVVKLRKVMGYPYSCIMKALSDLFLEIKVLYRLKCVLDIQFIQVEKVRGIVLVEKTDSTTQYFGELQNFVAITLGMIVIPVSTQEEAAKLLVQMVSFVCSVCTPFAL